MNKGEKNIEQLGKSTFFTLKLKSVVDCLLFKMNKVEF